MEKKILIMVGIVFLAIGIIGISDNFAGGTTSGTTITNTAKISGGNFSDLSNSITTNVRTIIGASWAGGADKTGISGGNVTVLTTHFTNLGNVDGTVWKFGVISSNYTGSLGTIPWKWVFQTNAGASYVTAFSNDAGTNASSAFQLTMNIGAVKTILFRVYVDATASSGTAWWHISATNITGGMNTGRYQSDDGSTWYGGAATIGFGENTANRVDLYSAGTTSDYNYEISLNAPKISITKTITGIVTSGAGPDNVAIPGATITYQIFITNTNTGGDATAVVVKDYITTNGASGVILGDMSVGTGSETSWDQRTNGLVGNRVEVVWSNTSANGAIEAGNSARLNFTVIIK